MADKIQLVSEARVSDALLQRFGEKIAQAKESALAKLKSNYRAGNTDAVTLASGVAAYCALEDFESLLTKDIRQGRSAAKELYDDHGRSESATGEPAS